MFYPVARSFNNSSVSPPLGRANTNPHRSTYPRGALEASRGTKEALDQGDGVPMSHFELEKCLNRIPMSLRYGHVSC